MSSLDLTQFILGWRGYVLGRCHQWYPHQRVSGARLGWLIAAGVPQVHQLKRVAAFLGGLFVGGATLWLYGATRPNMGWRPRRDSDYADRPNEFCWGRAWSLWWSGQLSNSVYVRWRRTRMRRATLSLVKPYPYRIRYRRRRRRRRRWARLTRRWARLRRTGRLPRRCYRRSTPALVVLRRWWRRRVNHPGWINSDEEPPLLYQRRWGGYPTVGVIGLTREWTTHWSTRLFCRHRRRRGWIPPGGAYRWGLASAEWTLPEFQVTRPARRRRRRSHRVTRWVGQFQKWSTLFPGVVGTTATGMPPTMMEEAHAVGLPTVLWSVGVAPELTPWAVAWPSTRVDGLWRWLKLVWDWSRGMALLRSSALRLSAGGLLLK